METETAPPVDTTEPPRVIDPGVGCRFRWRCPYRVAICDTVTPQLRELRPDHRAACHVAQSEMPEPAPA
jgi:peptide/nickel transport system ATP-binding protein